ncbi:MAG: hypothetical protein JHC93_07570 [Parachlamydiales bacterium]|nr:hypothetical protein [Parachlamydiales bacterium]
MTITAKLFSGGPQFMGVAVDSLQGLKKLISKVDGQSKIEYFQKPCIAKERKIYVFPGGLTSYWDTVLKTQDLLVIRNDILQGDGYYGSCAGAYYAARQIEYTDYDRVYNKQRPLNLFPGKCIGPLIPNNCPLDVIDYAKDTKAFEFGAKAIRVQWLETQEVGYVLIHGGGYFVADEDAKNVEVLARYVDVPEMGYKIPNDQTAAVVRCGNTILSGVHWEYESTDLHDESFFSLYPDVLQKVRNLKQALDSSVVFRRVCFDQIWKKLKSNQSSSAEIFDYHHVQNGFKSSL